MTGPKPRPRKKSEEDELLEEAYGKKGAALRKTAGTMGKGLAKADSAQRSLAGRVKSFLKRTTGR